MAVTAVSIPAADTTARTLQWTVDIAVRTRRRHMQAVPLAAAIAHPTNADTAAASIRQMAAGTVEGTTIKQS